MSDYQTTGGSLKLKGGDVKKKCACAPLPRARVLDVPKRNSKRRRAK